MPFAFGRLYRRLGASYFWLFAAFEVTSASLICLATIGLFSLYEEMTAEEFWRVWVFSDAWVVSPSPTASSSRTSSPGR
jgi:hypothetical protein